MTNDRVLSAHTTGMRPPMAKPSTTPTLLLLMESCEKLNIFLDKHNAAQDKSMITKQNQEAMEITL